MHLAAEIVLVVVMLVSILVVAGLFIWAARKDGEDDRAVQKRLGIRRRTRLGR
jgi:type II secretory pathway pseudopilin PulG